MLVVGVVEIGALYSWPASLVDTATAVPIENIAVSYASTAGIAFSALLFVVYVPAMAALRPHLPANEGTSTWPLLGRILQALTPFAIGLPLSQLVNLLQGS
jgi:hypothetical protein